MRLEWDEGVCGGSEFRDIAGEPGALAVIGEPCFWWADERYDLTHTLTGPLWPMCGKFTIRSQVWVEAGDHCLGLAAVQATGDGGRDI